MPIKRKSFAPKKAASNDSSVRAKSNKVVPLGDGTAIITHTQSIKQSMNYQSAECVYGVQMTVADNDSSILEGFKRAEALIEQPLVDKFELQRETLQRLA